MIMRWLCALRMHRRCIVVYRSLTWICCIFQIMTEKCFLYLCFLNNWTPLCCVIPGYWLSRISVIRHWILLKRYQLLDLNSFRPWYSKYSRQCIEKFTTTHFIWIINVESPPYPLYFVCKMWHSYVNNLKLKEIAWTYLFKASYDTILYYGDLMMFSTLPQSLDWLVFLYWEKKNKRTMN